MFDEDAGQSGDIRRKKPNDPKPPSGSVNHDDFENSDLDTTDGIALDVQSDEIVKLVGFLRNVNYSTYQRQDFDDRLDSAKEALQQLNYKKDLGKGYLKDEADRLAEHYNGIPLSMSWIAGLVVLGAAVCSFAFRALFRFYPLDFLLAFAKVPHAYNSVINFAALSLISFAVYYVALWVGRGWSRFRWWRVFDYDNAKNGLAKTIRARNHDVLVNKIKNAQQIAAERARNKDPDRGASGLLRVYLLFVCGYVLHKTLNRCHTRFRQDFRQIWVPSVKARINRLGIATLTACAAFAITAIYKFTQFSSDTSLLFSLVFCLLLPLAVAWGVQRDLHREAMRASGKVEKHVKFLEDLYHTHISTELLTAFDERDSERARFDFPDIYEYNDIEEYASWLHGTLGALKRHEDETRK